MHSTDFSSKFKPKHWLTINTLHIKHPNWMVMQSSKVMKATLAMKVRGMNCADGTLIRGIWQ